MKSTLILAFLFGCTFSYADPLKLHTGIASWCEGDLVQDFIAKYPKYDPQTDCNTVCIHEDERANVQIACYAVHQFDADEVKNFLNSIILPLREEGHVALIRSTVQSEKNFFQLLKKLKKFGPLACNAAEDNIRSAKRSLNGLLPESEDYKAAEFGLDRELKFMALTRKFHQCKLSEI